MSAVAHLQSAFEEARGYAKYHPSRGYWWDFSKGTTSGSNISTQLANLNSSGNKDQNEAAIAGSTTSKIGDKKPKKHTKNKDRGDEREEPSSIFQRRRVDMLLDLWMRNFPPKVQGNAVTATATVAPSTTGTNANPGKYAINLAPDWNFSPPTKKINVSIHPSNAPLPSYYIWAYIALYFSASDIKPEADKVADPTSTTQQIKSEVSSTASPHSSTDVGTRGIKREANFSQTANRGPPESKKTKTS